ncbi:MAG: tRNA (adenosine(37)-N6)-threonylcarbamoyltransferase complex transferase subunit TsaD [bacterium]|nr:tRNA (adenosine(37)-N6)-threonylcarbamoyltransferase complex transferase subunit TsaD [bacterium]
MKILGIETSCDETAAAIVENGSKLLSNIYASSASIHTKTGGIIPEIAAREQTKSIIPVIQRAVFDAAGYDRQAVEADFVATKWARENLDAIAVTVGPGLIGSLLVGVEVAKTLAWVWDKPIVPVVHTLAHVYANWLSGQPFPEFPTVVLTVSGGHTNLFLMEGHHSFRLIGETRDDTAGEAFDKIARFIGLSYPGGPAIQQLAQSGDPKRVALPRPMIASKNFDFSFSGLKTAVVRQAEAGSYKKEDVAASTQAAIIEVLVTKTLRALKIYKVKSLLLAGGVAANQTLRSQLKEKSPVPTYIPPIELCTDNGAFVASYAFYNYFPTPRNKIFAQADTYTALGKYAKNIYRSS